MKGMLSLILIGVVLLAIVTGVSLMYIHEAGHAESCTNNGYNVTSFNFFPWYSEEDGTFVSSVRCDIDMDENLINWIDENEAWEIDWWFISAYSDHEKEYFDKLRTGYNNLYGDV